MHPALAYHEVSKHQLQHYAPGPDALDWATQPDPFRRFAGAGRIELPLLAVELATSWDALGTPAGGAAFPLGLRGIAHLLQLSFGISAWKSYGDSRWALRCNPSSGNLHPTEAYLVCPALDDLEAGVYHYLAETHQLEQRAHAPLPLQNGILVALTGIHWREAWKYGVRAFRYCQHDCGHALAAVSYAAAALGWPACLLDDWSDTDIAAVTGCARAQDFVEAEPEAPEALVWIGHGEAPAPEALHTALRHARWRGRANRLSPAWRAWPEIAQMAQAAAKPRTSPWTAPNRPALPPLPPVSTAPVSRLIRQRRSAQAFDAHTALPAAAFFRMLDALLPGRRHPPWSLDAEPAAVHLALFVHRVDGLPPGLYCLPRDATALAELGEAMARNWLWQPVPSCPPHVPLYLLAEGDVREFARLASCHQDIAADSAFAAAMLARFADITPDRSWLYPRRMREAGMIGQALYLEAEAAGRQGTGIGCYFDDVIHEALGMKTTHYQDVYHFTVGSAMIDRRIRTEPAYPGEREEEW